MGVERVIGNPERICRLHGQQPLAYNKLHQYEEDLRARVFHALLHPQVEWSQKEPAELIRNAAYWKLAGFRTDDLESVADTYRQDLIVEDASSAKQAAALYRLIGREDSGKFQKAMSHVTWMDDIDYVYHIPGGNDSSVWYREVPPRYYFKALQEHFKDILSPKHCEEICDNSHFAEIYNILDRLHILLSPALQKTIHKRLMDIYRQNLKAAEHEEDEELPEEIRRVSFVSIYSENLPDLLTTSPLKLEKALLERRNA